MVVEMGDTYIGPEHRMIASSAVMKFPTAAVGLSVFAAPCEYFAVITLARVLRTIRSISGYFES